MFFIPPIILVLIAFAALWWHGAKRQEDLLYSEYFVKDPQKMKETHPEQYQKIFNLSHKK